jgi:hypothetical protein
MLNFNAICEFLNYIIGSADIHLKLSSIHLLDPSHEGKISIPLNTGLKVVGDGTEKFHVNEP